MARAKSTKKKRTNKRRHAAPVQAVEVCLSGCCRPEVVTIPASLLREVVGRPFPVWVNP